VIKAAAIVLFVLGGVAQAQPSATPPTSYPPYPPPYAYGPPPPRLQLTADEMGTLATGYITDGQFIGGGLASLFVGFGVGQAVEGRWHDTGWIFTLGEPLAFGVMIYGLGQSLDCFETSTNSCRNAGAGALVAGAIGLVGLRLWEVIDAFVGPGRQNARWTALQQRMGNPVPFAVRPFVVPSGDGGAVAGVSLRF
jgi:hypothetical protein